MITPFDKDVALAITAFDRPGCLTKLLESIQTYHPNTPVYIADDGYRPFKPDPLLSNYHYYRVPVDTGISLKRNHLVSVIQEPYTLIMEDDFVITEHTHLQKLYNILNTTDLDLIAGWARMPGNSNQYAGTISDSVDGRVTMKLLPELLAPDVAQQVWYPCDLVANFFLAKTEALRRCKWDPILRLCEHWEYFYRAKHLLKIGYCPSVIIDHVHPPVKDLHYYSHRKNIWPSLYLGMKKHAIHELATMTCTYTIATVEKYALKSSPTIQQHTVKQRKQTTLCNAKLAKMHTRPRLIPPGGRPLPIRRVKYH